jgi:hypothetical protein
VAFFLSNSLKVEKNFKEREFWIRKIDQLSNDQRTERFFLEKKSSFLRSFLFFTKNTMNLAKISYRPLTQRKNHKKVTWHPGLSLSEMMGILIFFFISLDIGLSNITIRHVFLVASEIISSDSKRNASH